MVVSSLILSKDKDIYGILKKVRDCKYFEKQEEEPAKDESAEVGDEKDASEPAEPEAEGTSSAESSPAFTSDVRGAEVCEEVPSDQQVSMTYCFCIFATFTAKLSFFFLNEAANKHLA